MKSTDKMFTKKELSSYHSEEFYKEWETNIRINASLLHFIRHLRDFLVNVASAEDICIYITSILMSYNN